MRPPIKRPVGSNGPGSESETISSAGDARRDRWHDHRSARRAELVEAAIRAITAHGCGVGMDEIAAAAGITKPVLYRHFTDKADLYLAVSDRATTVLMETLTPAIEAPEGTAVRERIRRIVDAYLLTVESNPNLYRFMVNRSFARLDTDRVFANESLIATVLARRLAEHLSALGMDATAAEPYAHSVVGGVQAAGAWWLDRQSMSRSMLCDHLTEMLWYTVDGMTRARGLRLDPEQPDR